MKRALILGARSPIAEAIAKKLAVSGWNLVLGARQIEEMKPVASDLELTCRVDVSLIEFDALQFEDLPTLPNRIRDKAGDFQLVVLVFGYMGNQVEVRTDADEMRKTLETNFVAAAITLGSLANYLETQSKSCKCGIIAITSVAGDRGRQSNYIYGAAKGGLNLYLQGLRNRLYPVGIHVLTVKPGFVDTPMTEGLEGLFLVASPERVANDILRAYNRRKDVIYTPWFWRWILTIIRLIPERFFKKLSL